MLMVHDLKKDYSPHTSHISAQQSNSSKMQMKRKKTSERKYSLFHLFFWFARHGYNLKGASP